MRRRWMGRDVKLFAWGMGQDGCSYYRLVLPLTTLAEDPGMDLDLVVGRGLPSSVRDGSSGVDVVVSQRLIEPRVVDAWQQMATDGRTLVVDYDDDHFSLRDDNPAWRNPSSNWPNKEAWDREWLPAMERAIAAATLVTCSTDYLANVLRQHSDKVVVLPNRIDAGLFAADQPLRGPGEHLRVGWAGSATHDKDWAQAAPHIAHGLRKVPDSEMVMMGHDYGPAVGHRRSSFRPWQVDMTAYYNSMTDLHVGLAPLANDQFNRSKSCVKALEYAALGIPVIASDVGSYHDFVQHGVTGFLVKNSHEWSRYIRMLGSDEGLRRQMGAAAREVAREHTVQEHAHEWLDAYRTVMPCAGQSCERQLDLADSGRQTSDALWEAISMLQSLERSQVP